MNLIDNPVITKLGGHAKKRSGGYQWGFFISFSVGIV
jgi:hypothetical protein